MKSDVYFVKIDGSSIKQRLAGLKRILERSNPFAKYEKDELVPVKITLGDSSCVYNIDPKLVKIVIAKIKEARAKPFLFDTSVIYKGQRQNALDHLNLAQEKGFGQFEVGAPFLIADGLLGQDGKEYIIDSPDIKKIKVPSFIGVLDSLFVITHITGHILSIYAGAIKNVAMGMSSRATKQVQHSSVRPHVLEESCTACGSCIDICPQGAISRRPQKAFIDEKACVGCGECICACKFDAISVNWSEDPHVFSRRMAEVANFILSKFKNKFFLNMAFDVTKDCDCISTKSDSMISDNIGILASQDIVSVDRATADLAYEHRKSNFLSDSKDITDSLLEHASKIGLGNLEYNLIHVASEYIML